MIFNWRNAQGMNGRIHKLILNKAMLVQLLGLLCFVIFTTFVSANQIEAQRAAFKQAVKFAQSGDAKSLSHESRLLQNYLLKPDIQAIYLNRTVKRQSNKTIKNFLASYPDHATSNDLLRKWLNHLHATGQWKAYIEHAPVPDFSKDRVSRRCQYLEAQSKAWQTVDFNQFALPIWLVGKSQPDECDGLFEILKARGYLKSDQIHSRIELSLEKAKFKLATYLSGFLSNKERSKIAGKIALWRKMSINPGKMLKDARTWKDTKTSQAIVAYGIRKQARLDIDTAINLWSDLRDKFSFNNSERNAIENYLALRAAYQRHPKTQQVYSLSDNNSMSLREREWQIRNALWKQDWRKVLIAIDQMPETSRKTSQWQYWSARALGELGQVNEAKAIYQDLASKHGYFNFLAADQLNTNYYFSHTPVVANENILQKLATRQDLQRARELLAVNMPGRSRSEWRSALKRMQADEKTQAGLLAQRWNLPTSSIQTAVNSGARADIDILYPRAYEEYVLQTAKRFALEPAWVFGVIRQESLFMPDVRSSANAYGLMQLLPATAKQTARKNKIKYRGYSHLITPSRNIVLGSAYLAEVNRRLQSNPALATAAYNGGPHRVRKWLPKHSMPADIWVENIVFNETRNYVQKVLTNKVIYSWRMQGQPLRLNSFMKTVRPLDSIRTAQN
jgi:soluble lytic murein transglycosylase